MDTSLTIITVSGENRIDSRLIAQSLDIEHKHFLGTLRTYQTELEELGSLTFETSVKKRTVGATHQTYVMLNEDQAIFASTLSRNSKRVVAFKKNLTIAFSATRKQLASQPASIHTVTDALRARALENSKRIPEDYYAVLDELMKHLYNLEALLNRSLDDKARIEISVGIRWSVYARDILHIPESQRLSYRHKLENGKITDANAYHILSIRKFGTWLWEVYFPENFTDYAAYRKTCVAKQQKRLKASK